MSKEEFGEGVPLVIPTEVLFVNYVSAEDRDDHVIIEIGYKHGDEVITYHRYALNKDKLSELIDKLMGVAGEVEVKVVREEKEKLPKPKPRRKKEKKVRKKLIEEVEKEEIEEKVCPECGYVNKPTAKFCAKCGTKLV